MSGIDDRTVSMHFDNEAFERNLSETIKSLDKLRQSLHFTEATRGMQEISEASNRFHLGGMGTAIDGVSNKFIALSTIAITALSNITNKAVNAASTFLKSFTITPITDGFREFETNMNSIQTILANTKDKGSTLSDVNAALDQLNTYSDKTIYNFSQMARNIGTFTAAGVDLKDSVTSIKGIANLAAISGSNSEQASTAMYQLSQALAAGRVNLMDWNSVVNAGMGGAVFKKALFETGKAMKTITDVPLSASFEDWEKKGGTFRNQIQKGWLTADVLRTTLSAFSGDLDVAGLKAVGFSETAAKKMVELGATGQAAATEVKTLGQLISTVKESVGSGWSQTFRTVIGDFEESKTLFTNINASIGHFVQKSADARNELLKGWKDLGGRDELINAFDHAATAVIRVLAPIQDAFREIFPPMTAQRLYDLTKAFTALMDHLTLGTETMDKSKRIFAGFFAVLSIGWEIIKNTFNLIRILISQFTGVGEGVLSFGANIGDSLVALNKFLVAGGEINRFFDKIAEVIIAPINYIKNLKVNLLEFFDAFKGSKSVEEVSGRIGSRFDSLSEAGNRLSAAWERLSGVFATFKKTLEKIGGYISNWFSELGQKLADEMGPGDFEGALDALNVGLFGGMIVLIKKFFKDGFKVDFGGGVIDKIKGSLDGVTGTLKAMQTQIKAKALLQIAAALGILTASMVVLSLIDSAALSKALVAISVGFGQLIASLILIDKMVGSAGAAGKLTIVGAALILLATAITILSVAVKNLSSLGLYELAKDLLGISVMLAALTASTQLISADTGGLIRAGLAMIAISSALVVLSYAVKQFADLSWSEMAKGLIGVAVGLGLIVLAMNFIPTNMLTSGLAIIAIATGLRILAEAVEAFSGMSWTKMGKGLAGVALGLTAIAFAMSLMPPGMILASIGITILSTALLILAKAIEAMGSLELSVLAKGIGSIAIALAILAPAMIAMTETLSGAAALFVVSTALLALSKVMVILGDMSIHKIATSLGAIAAVLIVLGIAAGVLTPVIPVLVSLGWALSLLGASFALFGAGAILVAKAFQIIAKVGKAAVVVLVDVIKTLVLALPKLVEALLKTVLAVIDDLVDAAPVIVKAIKVILGHILDTIIELMPKIALAFGEIITAGIMLIRENFPDLVKLGFEMFISLLKGIKDNIEQIVVLGVQILVRFAQSITDNMGKIVDAGLQMIFAFLQALTSRAKDIAEAGLSLIVGFLLGITQNINLVIGAIEYMIESILASFVGAAAKFIKAGFDLLIWLIKGVSDNVNKFVEAITNLIVKFINTLNDNTSKIIDAGFKLLTDFLSGIGRNLNKVVETVGSIVTTFITEIGKRTVDIAKAGTKALVDFLAEITGDVPKIAAAATKLITTIMDEIGKNTLIIVNKAAEVLEKFLNGLAEAIRTHSKDLRDSGINIAAAMIDGMTFGLASKAKNVADAAVGVAGKAVGAAGKFLGIHSPSRVFMRMGENMALGMAKGLTDENAATSSAVEMAEKIVNSFQEVLNKVPDTLSDIGNVIPVITPVLDLTKVKNASRSLEGLLSVSSIVPDVSFQQAKLISSTAEQQNIPTDSQTDNTPTEVTFIQNNYSPEALSTNDIYRNTRSQIALAKKELGIS